VLRFESILPFPRLWYKTRYYSDVGPNVDPPVSRQRGHRRTAKRTPNIQTWYSIMAVHIVARSVDGTPLLVAGAPLSIVVNDVVVAPAELSLEVIVETSDPGVVVGIPEGLPAVIVVSEEFVAKSPPRAFDVDEAQPHMSSAVVVMVLLLPAAASSQEAAAQALQVCVVMTHCSSLAQVRQMGIDCMQTTHDSGSRAARWGGSGPIFGGWYRIIDETTNGS
jgi:hypothetical protein